MIDPRDGTPTAFQKQAMALDAGPEHIRRLLSAILGRGIHDPHVWGRIPPDPLAAHQGGGPPARLARDLGDLLPATGSRSSRFRTHDDLTLETVVIPLAQARGGQPLPLLADRLRDGLRVLCHGPDAPPAQPGNLGDPRPVHPGTGTGPGDRPPRDRRCLHGHGRAVSELRARDGRRRPPSLSLRRHRSRPRPSPSAPSVSCRRSTGTRRKATSTGSSISLGAATDAKRARLVPLAARTPVAEVVAAARRHAIARKTRVTLAYVCIAGENTGEEDARALGELIGDTPVRLDLIEVTDPTGRFHPPAPDELRPSATR